MPWWGCFYLYDIVQMDLIGRMYKQFYHCLNWIFIFVLSRAGFIDPIFVWIVLAKEASWKPIILPLNT